MARTPRTCGSERGHLTFLAKGCFVVLCLFYSPMRWNAQVGNLEKIGKIHVT